MVSRAKRSSSRRTVLLAQLRTRSRNASGAKNGASNGDPRGLWGDLTNKWDINLVNQTLLVISTVTVALSS